MEKEIGTCPPNATRVFEVADGGVHIYPGNYEDFLWRKQQEANGAGPISATVPAPGAPVLTVAVASTTNGSIPVATEAGEKAKRLNPIKRKQMEERSREIEEDIARVEAAIAICESSLLNFVNAEETRRQNLDLEKHRAELVQLMTEWEEIGQALEAG